ncbi:uncharacterized protein EI90DRAFT_3013883 [Cantharellus anzutake]|uniref:uncharacterized protein n=1 Tax=Cantharellus anzutake TaxID=1750568 RepID=UPI0019059AF8|nr:uncharacterized protein EI90DRAFT_3013883 [Cantharellus anzutake]KAF8336893.1 hypothetical protein EI90DRAFT_3013883 [Cantharellus anzutake]
MTSFSAESWTRKHKIILGFDIGTTFSGVSFAYLFPEGPQMVTRVNAWLGQEAHVGASKIPTLVWYDKNKKATAFGAEMQDEAEDNGWSLAGNFKLHLHPGTMKKKHDLTVDLVDSELTIFATALPEGVPLSAMYRDFFGYLIKHTQDTFEERVLDGARVWKLHFPTADVVVAHPNGWGPREQEFMRRAAVAANIVPQSQSRTRIFFVTEGEASVHYCMFYANLASQLKENMKFIVCDAGGSTVDTTTYSVSKVRPRLRLREVKPSACIQAGGVFVNKAAEEYFQRVFSNPEANLPRDEVKDLVKNAVDAFEMTAKKTFKNATSKGSLDLGLSRYTNPAVGVRRGRMALDGTTIRTFFQPFVDQIVESLKEQMSGINCEHILVVGGSKAVSDGMIMWHATCLVTARACRFDYGVSNSTPYDSEDPRHTRRTPYSSFDGGNKISDVWCPLVRRGNIHQPNDDVELGWSRSYATPPNLCHITKTIYAYTLNGQEEPHFITDLYGTLAPGFEEICTISADMSGLSGALEECQGVQGKYWKLRFNICIKFGGTELQAYITWTEDGKNRTSEAQIIPNSLM